MKTTPSTSDQTLAQLTAALPGILQAHGHRVPEQWQCGRIFVVFAAQEVHARSYQELAPRLSPALGFDLVEVVHDIRSSDRYPVLLMANDGVQLIPVQLASSSLMSSELAQRLRKVALDVEAFRGTGRADWEVAMHRLWLTVQMRHVSHWSRHDASELRGQVQEAYRDARALVKADHEEFVRYCRTVAGNERHAKNVHGFILFCMATDLVSVPDEHQGWLATSIRDQLAALADESS